jgi:hypothetical protein
LICVLGLDLHRLLHAIIVSSPLINGVVLAVVQEEVGQVTVDHMVDHISQAEVQTGGTIE